MKILFATAELDPIARVGGLAQAAAGLVAALRAFGEDVHLVLPDYFGTPLESEKTATVQVPRWAGKVTTRSGVVEGVGNITLVSVPGIARPNPYTDSDGTGWPDNDERFFAFAAAIASCESAARRSFSSSSPRSISISRSSRRESIFSDTDFRDRVSRVSSTN